VKASHLFWTLLVISLAAAGCSRGFTSEDIEAIKKSIKQEFEKQEGVSVIEVVMMKESSTKAVGFVKLKLPTFGEISKSCSATMGEDGKNYLWSCE
jgi:hypothetical protein